MTKEFAEHFTKIWTDRMDMVFKKYVEGKHKPCKVTDRSEILAIGLGMEFADMRVDGDKLYVETKHPVEVQWTGEKFDIYINENEEMIRGNK